MLNGSSKDIICHHAREAVGEGGLGEVIQSYDTEFTTRTEINAYKKHCCIAYTKTHYLAPSVHREGMPFRQKTKLHSQYK